VPVRWCARRGSITDVMDPDFAQPAHSQSMDDLRVPEVAQDLADGLEPELVWRNNVAGLTFRLGDRYLKWNPSSAGTPMGLAATRRRAPSPVHTPRLLPARLTPMRGKTR